MESDGTRIVASGWRALARSVALYRANAKLPPGDPYNEVMAQACRNNPPLCIKGERVPYPPQNRDPRSGIKLRVMGWLASVIKMKKATPEEVTFVSGKEAKQRADLCAQCPHNVKMPEGCGSCRKALESLRREVIGGSRVADARLGGCEILGSDLATQAHLDEIRKSDPRLPAKCYRRTQV